MSNINSSNNINNINNKNNDNLKVSNNGLESSSSTIAKSIGGEDNSYKKLLSKSQDNSSIGNNNKNIRTEKRQQDEEEEEDIKNLNIQDQENKKTPFLVLAYLYFIVIASVLGTGILGLPVKLSQSGFTPFITSYSLCFIMQLLSLFFLQVEILQRSYSIIKGKFSKTNLPSTPDDSGIDKIRKKQEEEEEDLIIENKKNIKLEHLHHQPSSSTLLSPDLNNSNGGDDDSSIKSISPQLINDSYDDSINSTIDGINHQTDGPIVVLPNDHLEDETPNLHNIGLRFMGSISYIIFIFSVLLHFCSVLIGYGLAGSESYSLLFKIDESKQHYLILPVIVILTCIIVFGSKLLQHVITFCTFGKGTLLVIIVFITGIVSNHVNNEISNDFSYVGKSFLISTIALGGASSTLPVVFPKIVFNRRELIKCYIVSGSALFTVYVLNIIWCYFLLNIIPQQPNPDNPTMPSLSEAAKRGEIATVPLMKVVHLFYPQFLWITYIVNTFISISITISFISVGIGFKHTLDGFSNTWRSKSLSNSYHQQDLDEDFEEYNLRNGGGGGRNSHHRLSQHDNDDQEDIDNFFIGDDIINLPPPTNNIIITNNSSNNNNNDVGGSGEVTGGGSKISNKIKSFKQRLIYNWIHQYRRCRLWIDGKFNIINSMIDSKEGQSTWESHSAVRIPIREYIFYIVFFGFILLVALMNPRGFLSIMEGGTSLGLNMIAGPAMFIMIGNARKNYGHFSIPAELPNYLYNTRYLVLIYFTFAVLYDIYVLLF